MTAPTDERELADPVAARTSGRAGRGVLRLPATGVAAIIAAVGVYAVLASGVLPGSLAVAVPALLLVLVPTSGQLARRLAVNGLLLMACVPVLWWLPPPVAVDHAAASCAAVVAGLLVFVGSGVPRERARRLLPATTRSDLLVGAAVVWSVLAMNRWETARSPAAVLTFLMRGFDNVAHFDIVSVMLRHGSMLDVAARPSDGEWSRRDYPQGYHALSASFAELVAPHTVGGPSALVVYAHGVAALVTLGMVVLVSAVVSLPGLRDRPVVAGTTVVAIGTAFLWAPGGGVLLDGFANFWLGAVAVSAGLVLAVGAPARFSVTHWTAVVAALVVGAHAWAPLVILGGTSLVVSARACGRPRTRAHRAAAVVLVALLALGLLRAAWMLTRSVDVQAIVTAAGGITNPSPAPTMLLLIASGALFLGFGPLARRLGREDLGAPATLVRWTALLDVAGVVSLVALLAMQLHTLHSVSYYFFKYLVGFELVLAATTASVGGMCFALLVPRPAPGRPRALALTAAVAVAAVLTQAFGPVGWRDALVSPTPRRETDLSGRALSDAGMARGILAAVRGVSPARAADSEYLALGPARGFGPALPATWFHSLDGGLTSVQEQRLGAFASPSVGIAAAGRRARHVLERDRGARIVVAPPYLPAVRAAVGDPRLARRVTTWRSSGSVQAEGER